MSVDVACVGHPFLDLIFRGLPSIPAPGEEQMARELVIVPGAMANVAYACRRLGLDAVVVAPRGHDPAGRLLADLLDEAGVPWLGGDGQATPVSVALPAAGDRAFVTAAPPPAVDRETLVSLEPKAVVVDLPNAPLLPELPSAEAVYGVMGDPEVAILAGRLPETLEHLRALVLNDREARAVTGQADREDAAGTLAALGTTVVVTCGADGAIAVDADGSRARADAPTADVEDSTGAGDLFTAAYVWADRSGQDLEDRLAFGVRYASMSLAAAPADRQKGLTLEEVMQKV